jgi:hypothetical protein
MSYHIDRVLYDKDGNTTQDDKTAVAKAISKEINESALGDKRTVTKYYVKYAGYLYDPVQMNEVDARYRSWQMKEVPELTFNIYLDFLRTKKEHFRINAERLINAQTN